MEKLVFKQQDNTSTDSIIPIDSIPVIPTIETKEIAVPVSATLAEQIERQDKLVVFPSKISSGVVFELGAVADAKYISVTNEFLERGYKALKGPDAKFTAKDIFSLAYRIAIAATGEHEDHIEIIDPSKTIDLDNPPKTKCNIFNSVYIHLFNTLCKVLNADEISQKYQLLLSQANLVSTDIVGTIWHAHITVLSQDAEGNIYTSLIDPYHMEGEPKSIDSIISGLDFRGKRGLDAQVKALNELGSRLNADSLQYMLRLVKIHEKNPELFTPNVLQRIRQSIWQGRIRRDNFYIQGLTNKIALLEAKISQEAVSVDSEDMVTLRKLQADLNTIFYERAMINNYFALLLKP